MKIGITERGDAGIDLSWKNGLKRCDGVILITKAPSKLIREDLPEKSIIHCTITGYGGTRLEQGVNPKEVELKAYNKLFDKYGDRVVLRYEEWFGDL